MRRFGSIVMIIAAVLMPAWLFAAKTVYIPNEFTTLALDWSMTRSYQSDNFIVFWGTLAGDDPTTCSDTALRFNPANICATLETVYTKFITEIQFCSDDPAKNLGKYKCIIMMNDTFSSANGPSGWAFGGTYENTIGAMWVHPQATADGVVISHEFAHSMQGMISIQENTLGGGYVWWEPAGFFWECHANYMRAQYITASAYAYDMPRWLATTMFHWSSTRHHYDSFRPLFLMQELYGINMVNRLWKESLANEHPLVTFKRLMGWTQEQVNDFMFAYACREVNSDYPVNGFGTVIKNEMTRLVNDEPHYLWRQHTILRQIDGFTDRYIVPDESAPQDYGYNIIPIYPANTSLPVCVKLKGHEEANTYTGWRCGVVSVTTGGAARYGVINRESAEFSFQPMVDESAWYLVVTGAPVTHTSYVWEPGWPRIKRHPYEIRLSNAVPEGYQAGFRSVIKAKYAGHAHSNGGGWVANSATVAASVYVGPRAVVLGNSNLSGAVSVSGTAWVQNAAVSGNVVIDGNARVYSGTYTQNAHATGNAILYHCTVSGNVIAKDDVFSWGGIFSGSSVVGGDAEPARATVDGVYLQVPHGNNGRAENDGKGASDTSNVDVNAAITPFPDSFMKFTGGCAVSSPTPSPTATPISTSTGIATFTRTATASYTRTNTATMTPTGTVTVTATQAKTLTLTPVSTLTPTETRAGTLTATMTSTMTLTATLTSTLTATSIITATLTLTATPTSTLTTMPIITATLTLTATPTSTLMLTTPVTLTLTEPPTSIPTVTATPISTLEGVLEITNVKPYPNPYANGGSDFNVAFHTSRRTTNVTLKFYTASFRLVMKYTDPFDRQAGNCRLQVPAERFVNAASGTYYGVVEAKGHEGETARSAVFVALLIN